MLAYFILQLVAKTEWTELRLLPNKRGDGVTLWLRGVLYVQRRSFEREHEESSGQSDLHNSFGNCQKGEDTNLNLLFD